MTKSRLDEVFHLIGSKRGLSLLYQSQGEEKETNPKLLSMGVSIN